MGRRSRQQIILYVAIVVIVAATALISFLPLYFAGTSSVEKTVLNLRTAIVAKSVSNVDAFFRRGREAATTIRDLSRSQMLDVNESFRSPGGFLRLMQFQARTLSENNGTVNNIYFMMPLPTCFSVNMDARGIVEDGEVTVLHRASCYDFEVRSVPFHENLEEHINGTGYLRGSITFPAPISIRIEHYGPLIATGNEQWYPPIFSYDDVAIDFGVAVQYQDGSGLSQGIFAVSLLPANLIRILQSIEVGEKGRAMLVNAADGIMLANSWGEPNVFITTAANLTQGQDGVTRDYESFTDPLMKRVSETYGRAAILNGTVPFSTEMGEGGRGRVFVDIAAVTDRYGLNVRIVIAMPLDDFLGEFYAATDTVIAVVAPIVLVVAALAVSIVLSNRILLLRRNRLAPKEGPLTLIFTDIESSTALWNRVPDAMSRAVELHHSVIRDVLASYEAYEVKTVGDSFMIAVKEAAVAVAIALDIQLALHMSEWPLEMLTSTDESSVWNGLRVRIGLHECSKVEPKYDEDKHFWDYYGNDVNIAARLESKACGGQILVTESTLKSAERDPRYAELVGKPSCKLFARDVSLRGIEYRFTVFSLVPKQLEKRTFRRRSMMGNASTATEAALMLHISGSQSAFNSLNFLNTTTSGTNSVVNQGVLMDSTSEVDFPALGIGPVTASPPAGFSSNNPGGTGISSSASSAASTPSLTSVGGSDHMWASRRSRAQTPPETTQTTHRRPPSV